MGDDLYDLYLKYFKIKSELMKLENGSKNNVHKIAKYSKVIDK